jgi:pterin-4a-carbinolamine dehydratase
MAPLAFISYRREDSREWSALIFEGLRHAFGPDAVFMDVDAIRTGDKWSERISDALRTASVVLPVIGPKWLFVQDAAGRRRIDGESDWVRREVEEALGAGKAILPLLVGGAAVPSRSALPPSIAHVVELQFAPVSSRRDIDGLISQLADSFAFQRLREELDYPPRVDQSRALGPEALTQWLMEHAAWRRVERPLERGKDGTAHELVRTFKFRSYQDAVHFMLTASRFIDQTDHHPNWEHQYRDLRVRLSTWDIGHRISYRDTRLAAYLDDLHREYVLV